MMKQWVMRVALLVLPFTAMAEPLSVAASFSILADMTREIGGDRIAVITLVGPNQDAHVFQPSPSDVKRLAQAKVFITNGLGLEGWIARLSKSADFKGVQIEATHGIKPLRDSHMHGHEIDPHAWHDPQRVQIYIRNITNALIQADPAGKEEYQRRAANFSARVMELDEWAAATLAAIPNTRRKVLTAHDAFAYLGKRYNIRFFAPQGMSTDTEASAKSVGQLIRQLRQEKIKTVFFENMADKRLLQRIVSEAGVSIGGKLYSDALSEPGGVADSWQKMFRYNIDTLTRSM